MKVFPRFISVTKANRLRDRGLVEIDSICSIFEDGESHSVSIMTMDGFWYDVVESLEEIQKKISEATGEETDGSAMRKGKKEFFRQRKMRSPMANENRPHMEHKRDRVEDRRAIVKAMDAGREDDDVFRGARIKGYKRSDKGRDFASDLPLSEGKWHCKAEPGSRGRDALAERGSL